MTIVDDNWIYKQSVTGINRDVETILSNNTSEIKNTLEDWISPVEIFTKEFKNQVDDNIQQLIEIELGAKIDREELIKAMNYDRNQFAEGFKSGYAKRDSEIVRCEDCKHSVISHGRYCVFGDCLGCLVADDFFCKNGERIETEK